jgi:putative peptide maturation system protein
MTALTERAVDTQLLADAAHVLGELARDVPGARAAVADLQTRHAAHRLHLLVDQESYDDSVHCALLIRQADGLTLSLSAAAGPGLPWALRGVAKASEYDLLAVNGVRVPVADALACVDTLFDAPDLLRSLIDACLIGQALEEQPVDVSPALIQQTADAFRRARQLHSAQATRTWLAERSLSPERFAELIGDLARTRALRRTVAAGRIEDWFAGHGDELAAVSAAWAAVEDPAALEADPLAAIVRAHRSGRPGGVAEWRADQLPAGLRALASAEPGAATPVELDGAAAHAVVLDRRPAALDDTTREAVERRLFDEWLAERRRGAHVQWFWGDHARTQRALP